MLTDFENSFMAWSSNELSTKISLPLRNHVVPPCET